MMFIGGGIICLVLLLFVRQTMEKLYPIIQIFIFFLFVAQLFRHLLEPIFRKLATSFSNVPYSETLLYTAVLLLVNQLVEGLFHEHDQESIGQAITIAIQLSIVSIWLMKLQPVIAEMVALLQRVS
jgi:FtsH-binding integral membrane protein